MRSNLYVKFIILYIIFGFLSLFTTATLGSHLIFKSIERNDTSALYREASILASDYLPDYFTEYMSASDTRILLKNVNTYLDADLWLTDTEGKVLLTVTTGSLGTVPSQIRNFDPANPFKSKSPDRLTKGRPFVNTK